MSEEERYAELESKLNGIDESKKPFVLSLLKGFVHWEFIEQEIAQTKLFEKANYKGQIIMKELPSFKMLNTATARKEDAIKSIVRLLAGEVEEESPFVKALKGFNAKYNEQDNVEIR